MTTYAFDVRPEVAEQIESMGAQFVYLEFKNQLQDGAATGGYAAPSSPQFREAQLKKFPRNRARDGYRSSPPRCPRSRHASAVDERT